MVYSPKLGLILLKNQRIELSHRQERHYGVRALREEFDFSQDWLTASAQNGNPPTLTREQSAKGYKLSQEGNTWYVLDRDGNKIINTAQITPLAIASPQTILARLNGLEKTWALLAMLRLMYGAV